MSVCWSKALRDRLLCDGNGHRDFGPAPGMAGHIKVRRVSKQHVQTLAHIFHANAGALEHAA